MSEHKLAHKIKLSGISSAVRGALVPFWLDFHS
jgi:hypothetical protein